MTLSYGSKTFWGFSPALNMLSFFGDDYVKDEINILCIGASDARHVLKTVSSMKKNSPKINFYIAENDLELICRQVLFIDLALDVSYSEDEKANYLLDLYGNLFLNKSSKEYLSEKSKRFIDLVTQNESFSRCHFDSLKYKERDFINEIFNYWQDGRQFDAAVLWEERARRYLCLRYDSRENVYDWAYSMRLFELCPSISWFEYKTWREKGTAFSLNGKVLSNSNKTLASGVSLGREPNKISYCGDIVISPFVALCEHSKEKATFHNNNKVETASAINCALKNVKLMLQRFPSQNDPSQCTPDFEVYFLPQNCLQSMHNKGKFKNRFDLIYFSNSMVQNLKANISQLFAKPKGLLVVESVKYMLDLSIDQCKEYDNQVAKMAEDAGCSDEKLADDANRLFSYNT